MKFTTKQQQLHKFNVSHGSIVPSSGQCSDNPSITSISLPIPLWGFCKQSMDNLFLINKAKGLPSFMQGAILGQGNHFIDILPQRACSCSGSLDASILQELSGESPEKCSSLVRRPVEFRHFSSVPHGKESTSIVNCGKTVLITG